MVEVLSGVPEDEEDDEESEELVDTESEDPEPSGNAVSGTWDIDDDRLHLDAARIYENTIVQLGERLGDSLGAVNITAD